MAEPTSAKGPATGYLYQAYYSLHTLLEAEPGSSVYLEKLEDIDLHDGPCLHDGKVNQQLLQLKHKLKPGGVLLESSTDFIKTLSNWSERLLSNDFEPDSTILKLFTTQAIQPGSIPALLTNEYRNTREALTRLIDFINTSSQKTIKPYVDKLRKLTEEQLYTLLDIAEVVGNQPHINEIQSKLEKSLGILVQPRYLQEITDAVLGVWIQEVRRHLTTKNSSPITQIWLHDIARYHASFYRDESLPIYKNIKPESSEIESLDNRRFVKQLKKLGINTLRLNSYKEDYFLASHHISKWSRDNLVSIEFMQNYYSKLEREWREVLLTLVDELEHETEIERTKFGMKLLKILMLEKIPNIKKEVDEPFVGRGCYHILADEKDRLFWHPDFELKLLEQYLGEINSGAA